MINWMQFPKNRLADDISLQVIEAFQKVSDRIDSGSHEFVSDQVLAIIRPELESIGFSMEKGKKKEDKVSVPVLFGMNGKIEKSFDADGYMESCGYIIEVEAGRAVVNYQFLKDFFEACSMVGVDKLCIAVRNKYKQFNDFERVCKFFETLYASNRLGIPLSSLLIVGYYVQTRKVLWKW